MKTLIKILAIFILSLFTFSLVNAGAVDLDSVQGIDKIKNQSTNINSSGELYDIIQDTGFSILTIIKYIVSGLLVIFIVFISIQMIMSMGNDEEKLSSAKKQLRYTIMGLIFINIPGTLYNIFVPNRKAIDGTINGTWSSQQAVTNESLFINIDAFTQTINGGIILFIESAIFTIAVFMIMLSAIKIMTSRGREEQITESKNKIIWSLVGLVFVGFIESWQTFIFNGEVKDGATIFNTIENLALFFAGPVAIFFLTLAGYYYITANGEEDKIKKAKNIIVNTIIATAILMASHLFLQDLLKLSL